MHERRSKKPVSSWLMFQIRFTRVITHMSVLHAPHVGLGPAETGRGARAMDACEPRSMRVPLTAQRTGFFRVEFAPLSITPI